MSSEAAKPSKPSIAGVPASLWVRRYYRWRLDTALSGRAAEPAADIVAPAVRNAVDQDVDAFDVVAFMALLKRESLAHGAAADFRLAERRPPPVRHAQPAPTVPATARAARRRSVKLGELLRLDGIDFVRNAYIAVLAREADRGGLANYTRLLDGSRAAKIEVLRVLANSKEGRRRAARVPGLGFWVLYYRIRGRPLSELPRRILRKLRLAPPPAAADPR